MSRIAEFFVELSARGVDVVRGALASIVPAMQGLAREGRWSLIGMGDMFRGVADSSQQLGIALSPLSSRLYSFVQQGVSASSAGQILNLQFERLSHQIASLFVPQIRTLTTGLESLVRWFRSLTGEQQETLRRTGLFLGAIMVAGTVLPRVVAAITALRAAFQALNAVAFGASLTNPWMLAVAAIGLLLVALSDGETMMEKMANMTINLSKAFDGLAEVIKAVGTLLSALNVSGGDKDKGWGYYLRNYAPVAAGGDAGELIAEAAGGGKEAQAVGKATGAILLPIGVAGMISRLFGIMEMTGGDESKKRGDLGSRIGGFEGVDQTYRRVAQASLVATSGGAVKSPEERSADYLESILASVRRINGQIDESKPSVKN